MKCFGHILHSDGSDHSMSSHGVTFPTGPQNGILSNIELLLLVFRCCSGKKK